MKLRKTLQNVFSLHWGCGHKWIRAQVSDLSVDEFTSGFNTIYTFLSK